MLDRIDIHVEVPQVDSEKLSGGRMRESSASIRVRGQAMWDIQQRRFSNIVGSADMYVKEGTQDVRKVNPHI